MSDSTQRTTAEDVTQGLDLSGQIALVTGCTAGIGMESMRVLALRGAHVLATGRTQAKVERVCQAMPGTITPLALELTDLDSVNRCAATIASMGIVPDIVMCNAGVDNFGGIEFVSGIEKVFFTNFLSHFVLVNNLLPNMLRRGGGRLVHVSSNCAYQTGPKGVPAEGIDFDNLRGEGVFHAQAAYARSKLANALFSFELARRLDGTGVTSNALHPGSILTNIAHSAPTEIRDGIKKYAHRLMTLAQGAATQVYVATRPELSQISGQFFERCQPLCPEGPHFLEDKRLAETLWATAVKMAQGHLVPWLE